ncbi:hypothetical protein M0802_002632 [Mischocyttarus mexicanus]|nr:hypothetical protein M0802_002632 [Mischocyttarus mexicanus]
MIVSPSVSLVAAGVASGLCFILFSTLRKGSWARKKEKWFETFGGTFKKEELHRYFDTAKSRVYVEGVENAATGSGLDLATGGQEDPNTMETVRVFIEKIIEDLIGNVDDASIARLYDHPEYDRLLATYSVQLADALARLAVSVHLSITNKPSTDSPTMAHSALHELVERAVEDAKKLPGLSDSTADNSRTHEECNISEHSYEDLLATAILNKVVEKFQKEQVDGNSNVLHEKPSAKAESETELGLDEGVEEGSSSLEPLSQDECSSDCSVSRARHSRNRQEPLSLTIEERIEEVTTTYTSDEDPPECVKNGLHFTNVRRVPFPELGMDIIDQIYCYYNSSASQESSDESQDEENESTAHVDLVAPLQSWEENWLFQKKRVPIQSDPVAMLVPSSSADFKALIGDKDAEDTSDLSECSSAQSDEEIEKELLEAINNVVPRSPKISECEIVKSLNENETVSKDVIDFHSMENNSEFIKTSLTLDYNNKTNQLSNGDVKCIGDMNNGNYFLNNNNNNIEKEEMNYKIEINDQKFDTRSEYEVNKKHIVDSKTEIQRTDIRLLQSQKDTSPDVPKTPTQSTQSSMLENNLEVIPNDMVGLNEEDNFKSLSDIQNEIIDQDINDEEDKRMVYSLNDYSKEEVHFEDGAQQESEYTEHYDTATQRHLDSLTKPDINDEVLETTVNDTELTSNLSSKEETYKYREAVANVKVDSDSYSSLEKTAEKDIQLSTPPRPGTIAEREHKKWENAAPIENNPYSEKSIKKRLLERQYSRRSADMPGINTELPLSNGTDLVLEPNEPDIKRFGRDYYINNARSASGDKLRKSLTASGSSRPGSSLSQRSNSTTGTDQEQQVSFELGKFEEASLHGSLSRRSYCDRHASPNFAINPLLRLEFDESFDDIKILDKSNSMTDKSDENIFMIDDQTCIKDKVETINDLWANEITNKFQNDTVVIDNVKINPLYLPPNNECLPIGPNSNDRDSGMDSIESYDLTMRSDKTNNVYLDKLSCSKDEIIARENQIISTNNKRYLNTFNYKYHTFGGIRNSVLYSQDRAIYSEDDDLENDVAENNFFFGSPDFVNMKFQTFGGIKRSKKIDSKKIKNYSKIKLRPTVQIIKGSKGNRSANKSIINENKLEEVKKDEIIDEDDWLDEDEHLETRSLDYKFKSDSRDSSRLLNRNSNIKNRRKRILKRQNRVESLEDNKYDEDKKKLENRDNNTNDAKTTNSINDTLNNWKSLSSNNLSFYHSLDLSKKNKIRKINYIKGKLIKQHSCSSEEGNLKLEPPVVPQVIERGFKTLKELKNSSSRKKKCKDNPTNKILGIRSLSNVTIW